MPRNASGTYVLPIGNPVEPGTVIESEWANTTLEDIGNELTNSLSRTGSGGMLAPFRLADGTQAAPGVAWLNEPSTGFYRAGAGEMWGVAQGAKVLQYTSNGVMVPSDKTLVAQGVAQFLSTMSVTGAATFNGNTTFNGTTNTFVNSTAYFPQLINRNTTNDGNASYMVMEKIRGTSAVQNGDVLGNLVFRGFDGTQYLQGAYINAVVSAAPGTNDMPTDLAFGTTPDAGAGPSERMRLDSSGNLGLGVTPSAWANGYKAIQINQSALSSAGNAVYLTQNSYQDSGGTNRYISTGAAGSTGWEGNAYKWYTAPSGTAGNAISFTQAMTLDASGRLGIGTSSPTTKLEVAGSVKATGCFFVGTTGAGGFAAISTVDGLVSNGGAIAVRDNSATYNTGGMEFYAAGAERARIDSSGNLLVGTTSPANGTNTFYRANGYCLTTQVNTTAGPTYHIVFNNPNGAVGSISTNGSTTTFSTASDYRLKEDVQPMTGALAKVAALKPCTYKWKADGSDGEGFIAHELQAVVPQCVTGEKDAVDADGKPVYQGIDTSFLVATLTAAIQEQQAIIEQLKADVAALKAKA